MANEESSSGDVLAVDDPERQSAQRGTDHAEESRENAESNVGESLAKPAGRMMIDPRGPRFGAAITVVVLAAALLTIPSVASVALLFLQAIAFGAAALLGIQAQPYGWIYRKAVAPRLRPPRDLEDAAPPRFAQQVGLVFVLIALVGLALSAPVVAQIATAFALAAAFLNAVFNFCLGCEMYLLFHRVRSRRAARGRSAVSGAEQSGEEESGEEESREKLSGEEPQSDHTEGSTRDSAHRTEEGTPQSAEGSDETAQEADDASAAGDAEAAADAEAAGDAADESVVADGADGADAGGIDVEADDTAETTAETIVETTAETTREDTAEDAEGTLTDPDADPDSVAESGAKAG